MINMEKQEIEIKDNISTEPCSVTITVNSFSNIIPSDFTDNLVSHIEFSEEGNDPVGSPSDKTAKCMLSEKTNIDDIVAIFNDAEVRDLSDIFYTDDSVGTVPSDTQTFQANKKISKVLKDSGSFDSINDAQVLKHRLRSLEIEKLALMVDHNNLIREFNDSVESHLEEIRTLSEMNENYDNEMQELRDLICYLDDDRKKYKKMAKEWQKFGRHMVSVIKGEVTAYQEKLIALESNQKLLISENLQLRDICVHLDRQRSVSSKDVGDDSGTMLTVCSECSRLETPTGSNKWKGSSKPKNLGENYRQASTGAVSSQKSSPKDNDILVTPEREKEELHRILMYRNDTRSEKKRVKFDFPDDSDSSTASDVDDSEFPTKIVDIERKSKLGKANPNLSISKEETTSVNKDRVSPKGNILKKFDEENLSSDHLFFPMSPKKLQKSTVASHENTEKRIEQLKSEFNGSHAVLGKSSSKPTPDNKHLPDNIYESDFNEDPFDHVELKQGHL